MWVSRTHGWGLHTAHALPAGMSNPQRASGSRELVDDIVELAEITAPTFSEEARLVWLERRLDRLAGTRRRDSVGNLIWTFGDGSPEVARDRARRHGVRERRAAGGNAGRQPSLRPGVGDNAAAIATVIRVVEDLAADGETDGVAAALIDVLGALHMKIRGEVG